jgi:hypothetical protein
MDSCHVHAAQNVNGPINLTSVNRGKSCCSHLWRHLRHTQSKATQSATLAIPSDLVQTRRSDEHSPRCSGQSSVARLGNMSRALTRVAA